MASATVDPASGPRAGKLLLAALADRGTAAHPYPGGALLRQGADAARNLADAVHFLCMLHGRHPGVIDHAFGRAAESPGREWLMTASDAFAAERNYLTRLAVAAGPVPSTPGAADSDSVVLAQRHAVEHLGQSERRGCPLGAALGLAADWGSVRDVLDSAAERFGVPFPPRNIEDVGALAELADDAASGLAQERAMLFGAQQMLIQHHGLWDLLEARALARAG